MTAMNIKNLEKLVREALKGDNAIEKSKTMLDSRAITSAEHKSFNQMTFQISNVDAGAGAGTVVAAVPCLTWI